jgi:hypothetical protein
MRRISLFTLLTILMMAGVSFVLLPALMSSALPIDSSKAAMPDLQLSFRHARGNAQNDDLGYVCEYPPQPNVHETEHFFINYDTLGRGLTIEDYADALEEAYRIQVEEYGWAAPPLCADGERECERANPWGKYPVQIYDLSGDEGDYDGFVNIVGDYAGVVGDNPNTPARERAAAATCMVIHSYPRQPDDFTKLEYVYGTAQHEFQHMIQYGYIGEGYDKSGGVIFNNMWYESVATYFEEETGDDVNFPNSLLWSNHTACLADYDRTGDPYQNWLFFRYVAEQYGGANRADGGENVLQLFWEKAVTGTNAVGTMDETLWEYGTTLDDTFHNYATAYAFSKSCEGGYTAPYCLEEGSEYVDWADAPEREETIKQATGVYRGTIREGYSMNFIDVPVGRSYSLTLDNTARGGILRASLVCDTGRTLNVTPFPEFEIPSGSESTISRFEADDCEQATVVITSHTNNDACTARAYRVTLGEPSDTVAPTATVRPRATPRPTEVASADPTRQPSTRPTRTGADGANAPASSGGNDGTDVLSCIPAMAALLALAVWRRRVL